MHRILTTAIVSLVAIGCSDAFAQGRYRAPAQTKGFVSVNGVYQATGTAFDERLQFTEFVETGTIESDFEAVPGVAFDGAAGLRVWRNIGVGLGVSSYAPPSDGRVTARIPHPLYLQQFREVAGEADLSRKETAIHASLLYFIPAGSRFMAVLGAGPTFFQADQSFVNDVIYDHEYPYDTATLRSVERDQESASGVGFHAALDATWRLSKSFGVGGVVRYSAATLSFTPASRTVDLEVGGLQAGLGLRVIF